MKLISATVRNYRCHRETTVDFDGNLVLVHGPNESGKSTLAEAIHRVLFLRATTGGKIQKSMISDQGGQPNVEVTFEVHGKKHILRKQFSGSNGTASLTSEDRETLSGDAAEEALTVLLKVNGLISGGGAARSLEKRWAHLWVWQGKSSETPLGALDESHSKLRDKLQGQTGQSVISSPVDNAVIDELTQWETENLKQKKGFKTNSDLDKAQKTLAAAQERATNAQGILDQLGDAAADFEQADADIERHNKNHSDAETQLKDIETQLKEVESLREQLKEKTRLSQEAEKEFTSLQQVDLEIRGLESQIKEAEEKAAPARQALERLQKDATSRKADYEQARQAREQSSQALSQARSISEAWQAHLDILRQAKRSTELQKQLEKIEKLKNEAKDVSKQLAPLEAFTDAAVKKLAKAEQDFEQARVKLEAYALQIEVLEADQDISLDGQSLEAGQKKILSQVAELQMGIGTRLRLTPGGAEDLESAREASNKAAENLKNALNALGVTSVEAAREQSRKRDNFSREFARLEKQLEDAEAEETEAALKDAEKLLTQLQARRDVSVPQDAKIDFSDDLQASETAGEKAQAALNSAKETFHNAESQEKATLKASEQASDQLKTAEKEYKKQNDQINDLKSQLKYALEKSGNSDSRSKSINTAKASLDQAREAEQTVWSGLDELGADQLDPVAQRLRAAIETDRQKLDEAKQRKIVAQTQLISSGSRDPESELKQAEAEADRCQKRFDQLKHQADVRSYLLGKLRAARQSTTAALTQPLEDAVNPYLKLLFGGSRARLFWAADGSRLERFQLDRTDKQNGVFEFDKLSHGTREQVALALRLAMAQLLAADHDGCLPLVLDDAFTHADKDRIEKLKTILFQASQNGLQILLLSCHPENYSGLSANEAILTKSTGRRPSEESPSQTSTVPDPPFSSEPDAASFLEALQSLGGKAGNTALRKQLGWDEPRYEAVKTELFNNNQIQPGRGRGGSVCLDL